MMPARRVDLIGVPFNSAGRIDGVARAPKALRRAGIVERLTTTGLVINDRGDLDLVTPTVERDTGSRVIGVAALASMTRRVREAVTDSRASGAFPLVLGGDCSVLLGCLAALVARQPPRLLFVDGHEDAWPPERSKTGEAADMELGWLLGLGVARLPDGLRSEIPVLAPEDLFVLGARDEQELAESKVSSIGDIVRIVRPDQIADASEVGDWAASTLSARGAWWLHIDLDVLATESLSAVDYPQPGGLAWPALTQITRRALASPAAIGWTVTIYNPDLDPSGHAADRIARYVADSLGSEEVASSASRTPTSMRRNQNTPPASNASPWRDH